MAKEIEELDDNFEELDFDFDDSEFDGFFNDSPPATGREALTSTLKNAGSSFIDEFKVSNVEDVAKLLEKTIPPVLKTNIDDLVDMKDSLYKEVEAYGPSIRSNTNKLISLTEKFLPKGGMIGNAITKLKEATAPEDSGYSDSGPSKEEVLNSKLVDMLENTIGAKSRKEHYEEKLKESLDYKKNLNTLQIQNYINANLERLNSFSMDVTSSYYRKSLELQFRQLDTSLEILTVNKVANETLKNQLEAIVRNTALPDAVKLRSAEVVSMLAKNKMAESGMNMMFGEGTKFDKIKKKALGKFSEVIQNVESSLAEAANMGEMAEMMREQSAAMGGMGGTAGSLAGEWAKNTIGGKISEKLMKTKFGNKAFATMQNIFTDPSEYFKEKVDKSYESKDKDSLKEKLKRTLFSNLSDITKNDFDEQIVSMDKVNMNEAAVFDNRFYTSVTKKIPTLIEELIQETASIYKLLSKNTGTDERAEKKIYDIDTNAMSTESETKEKISSKLSNAIKKGGGNWNVKRATDTLLKDSKFTFKPEERATIEKAIMEYMMNGGTASNKMFKDPEFLKRLKDPKLVKRAMRLNQQFETRGTDFEIASNKSDINSYLSKAMSSITNPKAIIEDFKDRGNLDQLAQLGIVKIDKLTGNVSVDNKKYKEIVGNTFYEEALKTHSGDNKKEKVKPLNKETAELLDTLKDANLADTELGKNISSKVDTVKEKVNAAKEYAKTKKPVQEILKAKDKIVDELTGENLDKNLEALAQELTKENLKKRATQAYDFAVNETSEESIKKRKEQGREFLNTAKEKANAFKETAKEELTKENLINREKELRKWIDEKVTKENATNIKNNLIEDFNKSDIKAMIDEKVKESTIAKVIDENIKKAIEAGESISKSELTTNILREINNGVNDLKGSEVFKDTTSKMTDAKKNLLDTKLNDKTIGEMIDEINAKKEDLLKPKDKEEDSSIPLSERKTLVESVSELADKVKLISNENEEEKDELLIAPITPLMDEKAEDNLLHKIANKFKKIIDPLKPKENIISTVNNKMEDNTREGVSEDNKEEALVSKEKDKTLVDKISELIESLTKNKEAIEENSDVVEKSKKDAGSKFAFNDTNKDGVREGSWKDRAKSMVRGAVDRIAGSGKKVDPEEEKSKKGLWDYLKMLLPFGGLLTTLISGVTGILSTVTSFGKGVFGLVSALSTVTKFVGSGIIGPIFKLIGGLMPGLLKMGIDVSTGALGAGWKGLKKFVGMSSVTKVAEKKVMGSIAKNVGKRALAKIPGLGIAAGAYLGYDYLKQGDTVGALGSWASTLMSQIPVIGTGAGLAMDAWLMKRDMDKEEEETNKEEEAVDQEAEEKEEKKKEEEKKAQEEWTQNEENIKKQLKDYENKYEDIEKEKEDLETEEANKAEQISNSNTGTKNSFDGTGDKEIDAAKQQTLDDIDRQRSAIQAKLQAANPGTQFQSTTGRGRYNAYGSFGKSSATTGDRFAIADEPMSYKNVVGASKDEIKKLIVENSKKAGMNPNIMLTMAAKESGMNPNSKSSTSTATGLFQFLNDTWRDVVRNYGSKYGLTPENANRLNPEHSTLMAAEYLKQNLAPIKQVKGNINATDAYLTHFLGPGGARKFLSASPSAPSSIMGDAVVKANSTIFTDGGRVRTIGEVYQVLAKQLKKTADQFGISGVIENKFQSGGEIDNATANIGSSGYNANAKGEAGLSGVADPFAVSKTSGANTGRANPSEQRSPATNTAISNNRTNNVTPPVMPNTYSSKGITNTPMNVSNAQSYTSQMDTSMNDSMMKSAVKQSIELSGNSSKQLDNIVANTKLTAENTTSANKLLSEIKDLLGKANLNSNTNTGTESNNSNTPKGKASEKEITEVVSTSRGSSLLDYFK